MATSPGGTSPSLGLRRGLPADAEACGRICYAALRAIAERHGFPPDFPSPADAVATVGRLLAHPGFHAIVAEVAKAFEEQELVEMLDTRIK